MARLLCALLAFVGLLVWGSVPQAQDTRQFYVAPIDGAGTDADPWRFRCVGGVDLRPFVGIHYALCASSSLPSDMTGVHQIGASSTSNIGAQKAALAVVVKRAIAANTVDELVIELLSSKLRAGKDGKLKIYLGEKTPFYQQTAWVPFRDGGMVADLSNAAMGLIEPTLALAATFTETFTGADTGTLGGDLTWTEFLDTAWTRTSNTAYAAGTTAAAAEARADSDTSTDDQAVQADMAYTYASAGNFRCFIIDRKNSTATRDFYAFGFQRDSGVNVYRLLERNAGSPTTLADSSGATSSTATLKLVSDGTSHAGYVNGAIVAGPVTDATITGNTRGGLAFTGGAAGDNCTADNWSIADYVPGTRSRGSAIWFQ